MKNLCLGIAVFFLTAMNVYSADFLYHSDGPYKGKVIDLETGEPIEGAAVAGVWVLEFNFTPFCDAVLTKYIKYQNNRDVIINIFCNVEISSFFSNVSSGTVHNAPL